jgi:hypothetical protein
MVDGVSYSLKICLSILKNAEFIYLDNIKKEITIKSIVIYMILSPLQLT